MGFITKYNSEEEFKENIEVHELNKNLLNKIEECKKLFIEKYRDAGATDRQIEKYLKKMEINYLINRYEDNEGLMVKIGGEAYYPILRGKEISKEVFEKYYWKHLCLGKW